jgi:hypothetical protein
MLKTKKVNKFVNRAIKAKNAYEFPVLKTTGDKSLLFAVMNGVRNSGKSNTTLCLLENDKDILLGNDAKVWFVSPTADAKVKKFEEEYPDNFVVVDELNRPNLQGVFDELKQRYTDWAEIKYVISLYERWLQDKPLNELEEEHLASFNYLENFDFAGFNEKHPPMNTLVIDDSACNPMLSQIQSRDGKFFTSFAIRHRHPPFCCNLIILTQHIKLISKPLRVNSNLIVVFPFRDASIYHSVFQEYSTLFNNDINLFLKVMQQIEDRNDHSHLTIYYDGRRFVRINWNEEIQFQAKTIEEACECEEK